MASGFYKALLFMSFLLCGMVEGAIPGSRIDSVTMAMWL